MKRRSIVTRTVTAVMLGAVFAGCGSTLRVPAVGTSIAAEVKENAAECPKTVLATVGQVLMRVYREGIASERTATAQHLIQISVPLRLAIEDNDPAAARTAARALLATGHMADLRVVSDGRTLVAVGGAALAPLEGKLIGANGEQIATYTTSVWSDDGFLSEARGVTEGLVALRQNDRSIGRSLAIAPGPLPNEGTLTQDHVLYRYTSFPATAYISPTPLRVYVLRSVHSTASSCGASHEDTVVNTLHRVANLIYAAETGQRRSEEVLRVQHSAALLEAVARHDPLATEVAIDALLNQHIVRMRVTGDGQLLCDVGGPYVLAPVTAPLRLNGRKIGSVELSIQDDEGYLRLTKRLAGMDVLMYMNGSDGQAELVKNSLGPSPGTVPASGNYRYRDQLFRVFTVAAQAFPSGPLTIRVLVPNPYR